MLLIFSSFRPLNVSVTITDGPGGTPTPTPLMITWTVITGVTEDEAPSYSRPCWGSTIPLSKFSTVHQCPQSAPFFFHVAACSGGVSDVEPVQSWADRSLSTRKLMARRTIKAHWSSAGDQTAANTARGGHDATQSPADGAGAPGHLSAGLKHICRYPLHVLGFLSFI